jgi:hypothetical protein
MRHRWIVVASLSAGVAGPEALVAQRVVTSLDLSGTSIWYADSLQAGGASLTPALRVDWSHATLSAFGNVSHLGSSGSSVEGLVSPSVFTPNLGPLVGEFAGSFGGSSHQDGTRTGQFLALGRLHLMTDRAGAYVGSDVGRTWDGSVWRVVREGEAGVWIDRGGGTWLATVTPVVVADSIRYTDVQAAVRYPFSTIDFGATVGMRSGAVGAAIGGTARVWGDVSVVAWLRPRLGLVASAGAYPVDLTQGYPGGRFVTVALRVSTRATERRRGVAERVEGAATGGGSGRGEHTLAVAPNVVSDAVDESRALGATAFELGTSGRQQVLRVYAPSAHAVEISGDFTRWKPLALTRANDGWWSLVKSITAGTHQMNVRVDGGSWLAPPGLLREADEFGGVVGILVVE